MRTRSLATFVSVALLLGTACGSSGGGEPTAAGQDRWVPVDRNGVTGFVDPGDGGTAWNFVSPNNGEVFAVDDELIDQAESALPAAFATSEQEMRAEQVDAEIEALDLDEYVRWYHGTFVGDDAKLLILLSSCSPSVSGLDELPTPDDGGPCTASAVFDVTSGQFEPIRFNGYS